MPGNKYAYKTKRKKSEAPTLTKKERDEFNKAYRALNLYVSEGMKPSWRRKSVHS